MTEPIKEGKDQLACGQRELDTQRFRGLISHDLMIYVKAEVRGSTMTRMWTEARQLGAWEDDRKGRNVG